LTPFRNPERFQEKKVSFEKKEGVVSYLAVRQFLVLLRQGVGKSRARGRRAGSRGFIGRQLDGRPERETTGKRGKASWGFS